MLSYFLLLASLAVDLQLHGHLVVDEEQLVASLQVALL